MMRENEQMNAREKEGMNAREMEMCTNILIHQHERPTQMRKHAETKVNKGKMTWLLEENAGCESHREMCDKCFERYLLY